MRLAMLYDYAVQRDGSRMWTQRAYGGYIDALAQYFERVVLFAPHVSSGGQAMLGYRVEATNVVLVPLPFFARWAGSLRAMIQVGPALLRSRKEWDVLYVRLPCPLAPSAFLVARILRRPLCLHVVGNLLEAMADYPPAVRPLARLVGHGFECLTQRASRHALTVTQGEALARRYAHSGATSVSVIESTIGDPDICERDASALRSPVRVLYVGALLEKKGLQFLIEAVAQLRREMDVQLVLVGSGPADAHFRRLAAQLGLGTAAQFVGSINSERELWQTYRMADIFVLPSLAEGVPRVLIEAMAQSVPVVSTSVGGIPGLIRDSWNGILVEPGSAAALCAGIKTALRDDNLRHRLVTNGIATARGLTREAHARELVRLLKQYLADKFPDKAVAWETPAPREPVTETHVRNQ